MKSTDISTVTTAATPVPLDWAALRLAWPGWPAPRRLQLARQAGCLLHTLWAGRDDLARLPPARWTVVLDAQGGPVLHAPLHLRHTLPLRLTAQQVLEVLALWLTATTGLVHRREQVAFARAFFQHEVMDRNAFRHALAGVARAARKDASFLARTLYREHFRQRRREGDLAGWACEAGLSLAELRDQIYRAEQDPATVWIKRRLPTRLFRTRLFGREVVVKRHDVRTNWERLRYRLRASRARRACAAALTLRDLGLPTPPPLAYLEISRTCSYMVNEWLPGVHSVRAWVRQHRRVWLEAEWTRWRRELFDFYLTPYTRGFYHDDTKALNVLLDPAGPPGHRLWWIDVEGVVPGAHLTRYRILRNLAQLNGSLRSWVPEGQRLAFLHALGWYFPWLHDPRVAERLRVWTRRRLQREVDGVVCGP